VHDSGDIGKAIAGAPQEGLVGAVLGSVSNELGHRPLDGGRPLDFLVQLRIKTKASHDTVASRWKPLGSHFSQAGSKVSTMVG
jgi:hypothetical protein